jgi:hypothetical protein
VQKVRFIYADLQRTHNRENEIFLNTNGTKEDLKRYGIELEGGKDYWFWRDDKEDDPLIFSGKVKLDGETKNWIAEIDTASVKNLSQSSFKDSYSVTDVIGK